MIKNILIANRGEIANRIIKTAKKMGIRTVSISTFAERDSLWANIADEAIILSEGDVDNIYINPIRILSLAKEYGCDAIHPGYGFLSENYEFAMACEREKVVFIGPNSDVIKLMGNKTEARTFVSKLNLPVPKGFSGSVNEILAKAPDLTFPVLIKAVAGGGGKGMYIAQNISDLESLLLRASNEALKWFANDKVFVEQYFKNARHIEVQILADHFGNCIHLYERECTLQRNYQKLIEEAPSPTLTTEQRNTITEAACKIAKAANYTNAGTIEFLWHDNQFWFLEMNTRIQVEHPVTEMITGIDIVEQQINVANNFSLKIRQKDINILGNAIEARIYAEQPNNNFKPSTGNIHFYEVPVNKSIRIDTMLNNSFNVSPFYDGLLSKVIAHGNTRNKAIDLLLASLKDYAIHGVQQNQSFLLSLIRSNNFLKNEIYTRFIDEHIFDLNKDTENAKSEIKQWVPALASILFQHYLPKYELPRGKQTRYQISELFNLSQQAAVNINPHCGIKGNTLWHQTEQLMPVRSINTMVDDTPIKLIIQNNSTHLSVIVKNKKYDFTINGFSNNRIAFTIDGELLEAIISEGSQAYWVQINGSIFQVKNQNNMKYAQVNKPTEWLADNNIEEVRSPLHGIITEVVSLQGTEVNMGDTLLVIESMKTENRIACPVNGTVSKVWVSEKSMVKEGDVLVSFNKN